MNGKGAESHGVDFEARYRINSEVTLSATYGWNRAKLTSPIEVGGVTYGAAGTILPGTPEHNVSLSADYQRPLSGPLNFDGHAEASPGGAI